MGLLTEGVQTPSQGYGFTVKGEGQYLAEAARIFDSNKDLKEKGIVNKKLIGGLLESKDIKEQKRAATTLRVLQTMQGYLEGGKSAFGESVFFSNFGPLAPKVFDIVNIFYPNIIAHDLVDVQPIDSPIGVIYSLVPTYSSTRAGVNAGDEIFKTMSPTSSYASEINYSSSTGDGSTTTFNFTLATPVRPGTVKLTVGSVVGKDTGVNGNAAATITGTGITAGTVNYVNGAVSITFAAAPANGSAIQVEYYQSHEGSNSINQVEFTLKQIPVEARYFPLKVVYSIASMMIANKQIGIDVSDTLVNEAAMLLKKERDNRLLSILKNSSTAYSSLNFDATPPAGYARKDKYAELEIKLGEASNRIQAAAGRGHCNFVVVGQNGANILQQSTGFRAEADVPQIGSYRIGTLRDGTIPVIKAAGDQGQIGDNDIIFGYKGYQFGDASVILAEFIPLYTTAEWQNPNLQNERGMLTAYDLKENNTKYLARGTISNYAG